MVRVLSLGLQLYSSMASFPTSCSSFLYMLESLDQGIRKFLITCNLSISNVISSLIFREECPDPATQLSFRSLLHPPSYLPHGLYLHSNSIFSISTRWGTAGHIAVSWKLLNMSHQGAKGAACF